MKHYSSSMYLNNQEKYDLFWSIEKIDKHSLSALINNEIYALRIPNFFAKKACADVTDKFLNSGMVQNYSNAKNIGRIGMAFYEVQDNPIKLAEYYKLANINQQVIKQTFSPYTSPIDTLIVDISKIWEAGCKIENLHGKNMFVGLLRVLEDGACIHPHQDILRRDARYSINAYSLLNQLAVNIYLNMPEIGGELQLWSNSCDDEEYKRLLTPGDYYVERSKLNSPVLSIKPEVGELILFNSTRYHAVTPARGVSRLSVSCFIGYRGEHSPLTFWS